MVNMTGHKFFEKVCETKAKNLKKRGQVKVSKVIFRSCIVLFLICMCINGVFIYNFFKVLGNL